MFLLLCMWENFWFNTRHSKFYSVGRVGYFCIPVNILDLWFRKNIMLIRLGFPGLLGFFGCNYSCIFSKTSLFPTILTRPFRDFLHWLVGCFLDPSLMSMLDVCTELTQGSASWKLSYLKSLNSLLGLNSRSLLGSTQASDFLRLCVSPSVI